MNAKTPDFEGRGTASGANLRCHTCGGTVAAGEEVLVRVSYNFYYDHCLFAHERCGWDGPEMWPVWRRYG